MSWADGKESASGTPSCAGAVPAPRARGDGRPGAAAVRRAPAPEQHQLRSIDLVGLYAIRPTWVDGHDTGIFTFERLRASPIAPAATTQATRAPDGAHLPGLGGLYFYIAFLVLDTLVLGSRGPPSCAPAPPAPSSCWPSRRLRLAGALFLRWGRLRVVITPEAMALSGQATARRSWWSGRTWSGCGRSKGRPISSPCGGSSRGRTSRTACCGGDGAEIDAHPGQKGPGAALVGGYGALQQGRVRQVPKDTAIDLHARWWRD